MVKNRYILLKISIMNNSTYKIAIIAIALVFVGCSDDPEMKCMNVRASAYNSVASQTRIGDGKITAWGDTLRSGVPSVAISRDLLDSGMVHGTMLYIEGFSEPFKVNDKMNRRYKNKIDLHLGTDVKAARNFGNQKLNICFEVPKNENATASN